MRNRSRFPGLEPALAIAAVAVLLVSFAGCGLFDGDDSPTAPPMPTPAPMLCPFSLTATPIAGFPGLYAVAPTVAGAYDISVNGTSRSVEFGQIVAAASGDIVQGCRACGCTPVVVVR